MSQLVRLEGKYSTQNAHCAVVKILKLTDKNSGHQDSKTGSFTLSFTLSLSPTEDPKLRGSKKEFQRDEQRQGVESGVCICVVVVVLIGDGLRGGTDLTVLQDKECAQGQHMVMVCAARQRVPAAIPKTKPGTRQGDAKPGG